MTHLAKEGEGVVVETRIGRLLADDTAARRVVRSANLDHGKDGVHELVGDDSGGVEVKDDGRRATDAALEGRTVAATRRRGDGPETLAIETLVARRVLEEGSVDAQKERAVHDALESVVAVQTVDGDELARSENLGARRAVGEERRVDALGKVCQKVVVELVTNQATVVGKGEREVLVLGGAA